MKRRDYAHLSVKARPSSQIRLTVPCAKCEGHGGWMEGETLMYCNQCLGWGWVTRAEENHVHEYKEVQEQQEADRIRGRFAFGPVKLATWRGARNELCVTCGMYRVIDSSD